MLDRTAAPSRGRVATLVEDLLAKAGRSGPVGADDRLVDAGLTSMDMVGLMLAVEAAFDLLIPPGDITPANFRSIASIEAMVQRLTSSAAA